MTSDIESKLAAMGVKRILLDYSELFSILLELHCLLTYSQVHADPQRFSCDMSHVNPYVLYVRRCHQIKLNKKQTFSSINNSSYYRRLEDSEIFIRKSIFFFSCVPVLHCELTITWTLESSSQPLSTSCSLKPEIFKIRTRCKIILQWWWWSEDSSTRFILARCMLRMNFKVSFSWDSKFQL